MTHVHWALNVSSSEVGSALDTTSSICSSTSNLQYINSQLVAHGFTSSPGISLDGISNDNVECVTKCLLAMLGQRVTDMSRAEELSTKLRTLSYDHERLMCMHRASTENELNAEREVNMYKSRLASATRSLRSSESSHKQTTAELQRTRTLLQALRTTHATELKRKEKEIERMVEKWAKLVDSQSKLSTASPGMIIRGANAEVASGMELLGKGKGYLEVALKHAENSRKELLDETTRLRRLILVSANRLQAMIHEIRILASIKSEEPSSFDHDALFPLRPINTADNRILSLFASANDAISMLSKHLSDSPNATHVATSGRPVEANSEDCKHLQAVIEKLQTELDEAKKLHETHAAETQELLNQVTVQRIQRASMDDLMITSERDAESDWLDRIKKELEDERDKFAHTIVMFGKEKAAFESERVKFLEERRSWQVQQMHPVHLSVSPPEALPPDVPFSPGLAGHLPEVTKSPRKSPRKQKVAGKSGNSRKTRASRRSTVFSILPPTNTEPAYETEVIPIVISTSKQQATDKPAVPTKSILPTFFVLPPPSPRTSLPPPDALLGSLDSHIPGCDSTLAKDSSSSARHPHLSLPDPISITIEPVPAPALIQKPAPAMPQTPPPFRRPFPIAKPLAPHMTHAYSPIKPSPLSRILMLADSPESPESKPLARADRENTMSAGHPTPAPTTPARNGGIEGKDEDNPLREKRAEKNVAQEKRDDKAETKQTSSKERVRGKEVTGADKPKTVGAGEKENRDKPSRRGSPPMLAAPTTKPPSSSTTNKLEAVVKSVTRAPAKLPVGKGGARRVPIGSAEAAPLPGWRG